MIAMSVASILLLGVTAGYSALGKASHRLALAQAGMADRSTPRCRPDPGTPLLKPSTRQRYRCDLPEICEYDTVSQTCRSMNFPST